MRSEGGHEGNLGNQSFPPAPTRENTDRDV
jgi:hypothetical protein